jgi:TetR/AcrR family transcriptional repressor of nem operon
VARPKAFDQEQALGRALDLFWTKGYEATSIQDLVDATGVQRQSLYDTFGDKRELYLRALARYAQDGEAFAASLERKVPHPLTALRETLLAMIDANDGKGCLIVNAAVEHGCGDPAVTTCVARHVDRLEQAFQRLLEHARKAGELRADVKVRDGARALVTLLWGLRAVARTGRDAAWLRAVVDEHLARLTAR